jgi:hypothetical protein
LFRPLNCPDVVKGLSGQVLLTRPFSSLAR